MTTQAEQYLGKVTPIGNSKGIRLDAAFFKAHPEFNGEVSVTVLADGHILLSTQSVSTHEVESAPEDSDPVMLSFLSFLQAEMQQHPEQIKPLDQKELDEIAELVAGAETE
jgi:prlF antitoxin for toxin YhaV_toxin